MKYPNVKTRAEAEQQDFTFSRFSDWHRLAYTVDGYALCKEMGVRWGEWKLPVVELAMLLFFIARKMYMSGGWDPFYKIDSLLHAIARQTGSSYETDLEVLKRIQSDDSNFPHVIDKHSNKISPPDSEA